MTDWTKELPPDAAPVTDSNIQLSPSSGITGTITFLPPGCVPLAGEAFDPSLLPGIPVLVGRQRFIVTAVETRIAFREAREGE